MPVYNCENQIQINYKVLSSPAYVCSDNVHFVSKLKKRHSSSFILVSISLLASHYYYFSIYILFSVTSFFTAVLIETHYFIANTHKLQHSLRQEVFSVSAHLRNIFFSLTIRHLVLKPSLQKKNMLQHIT